MQSRHSRTSPLSLMKDTVKSIVDKYGTSKIHYSVVIYGQTAFPTAALLRTSLTKKEVKEYIDSIPKPRGNYNTIGNSICHLTSYHNYSADRYSVPSSMQELCHVNIMA